ncbi:MFS transporter [Massilia endophytica]|uniref:MFS transporter n=1 Tax=Massilia endophytica TaxID=2899220 RepID=UPI001E327C45|nr:MFS transporter [Massilia endophytica]UGQ48581.1 MFS transporter [Massilia endophytica]
MGSPWRTIGILAVTQIASWGSLYYAFSVVAGAIGADLHLSPELVYGAFSASLLVTGACSTPTGIMLDRFGGRWVMAAGSLVCGLGLIWLSHANSALSYFGAWLLLGVAMALTLYEAAFATLNRKFASGARQAISTLTLFAGFASTIFWPLTLKLSNELGWRDSYFWFGIAQLVVCLPLHLLLGPDAPHVPPSGAQAVRSHTLAEALRHPAFWKLAFAFSANTFTFSALSVHLIPLLKDMGHVAGMAVLMASLIGPMQVAGRVLERTVARSALPQTVGKFTFAALPASLLALLLFGSQAWAVALFCLLYGLSNGIMTIVRGTIPQALFGAKNYGAISGAMAGPSLVSKAAGPLAAAFVLGGAHTQLLIAMLLAMSAVSFACYLSAIRHHVTGAMGEEQMQGT